MQVTDPEKSELFCIAPLDLIQMVYAHQWLTLPVPVTVEMTVQQWKQLVTGCHDYEGILFSGKWVEIIVRAGPRDSESPPVLFFVCFQSDSLEQEMMEYDRSLYQMIISSVMSDYSLCCYMWKSASSPVGKFLFLCLKKLHSVYRLSSSPQTLLWLHDCVALVVKHTVMPIPKWCLFLTLISQQGSESS